MERYTPPPVDPFEASGPVALESRIATDRVGEDAACPTPRSENRGPESPTRAASRASTEGEAGIHDRENTLSPGRRFIMVLIVAFTMMMSSAGLQGLNIAMPNLETDLNLTEGNLQWIPSAYSLTFGCFLLLSGRLADVYGRKKCYFIGIAWYAVWSLIGSFMHSGPAFIVTRAFAGMGASMGVPASMGIIAANIHGRQRATAFAVFAAGAPIGGGTGIVLGGVLTAYTDKSWRAVLWVLTGLAGLIALGALFVVPPDPKQKTAGSGRIDWLGAALVTVALVFIQFTIADGITAPKGWRTPYIPTLFVIGILLLVAFFFWEHYVAENTSRPPLLRLALFTRANGRLAAMYFVVFVGWMGYVSVGFHATLYFQQVQGTGPVGALLRFLPMPVSGLICVFVISKVVHFVPTQYLICIGVGATGLASTFMAVSSRTQNYWTFPFNAMYLVVVGADILMPTGSIFVSRLALPEEQSVAGALFQTLLQLGGAFGLTLTAVIGTAVQKKAEREPGMDRIDALLRGQHASFWLCAALSFTALVLAAVTLHGIGVVANVDSNGRSAKVTTTESGAEKGALEGRLPSELIKSDRSNDEVKVSKVVVP